MATVTIDAQRWERVRNAARIARSDDPGVGVDDGDLYGPFVAPVAPDPGLREAIAEAAAMSDTDMNLVWSGMTEEFRAHWLSVADAVLAVLAERGVR